MIDYDKLKNNLELIREFLYGAHLAKNDDSCDALLQLACHKIDDILMEVNP